MPKSYGAAEIVDRLIELQRSQPGLRVPLRQLGESLSTAPSAIYSHFPTRDALDATALQRIWESLPTLTDETDRRGPRTSNYARTSPGLLWFATRFDQPEPRDRTMAARSLGDGDLDVGDAAVGLVAQLWTLCLDVEQWAQAIARDLDDAVDVVRAVHGLAHRPPPPDVGSPIGALRWVADRASTPLARSYASTLASLGREPTYRELATDGGTSLGTAYRRGAHSLAEAVAIGIVDYFAVGIREHAELRDSFQLLRATWRFIVRSAAETPAFFQHVVMGRAGYSSLCLLVEGVATEARRLGDSCGRLSPRAETSVLAGLVRTRAAALQVMPEHAADTWALVDNMLHDGV